MGKEKYIHTTEKQLADMAKNRQSIIEAKPWGGKRPGAGRPVSPNPRTVSLNVRLSIKNAETLEQYSAILGGKTEVINFLIEHYLQPNILDPTKEKGDS